MWFNISPVVIDAMSFIQRFHLKKRGSPRFFHVRMTSAKRPVSVVRVSLHEGGGPQIGEVTCGTSPHLSCKRDQIKMRDYMDTE